VFYYDKDHTYYINGKRIKYSVSTVIKEFEPKFDSDGIATKFAKKHKLDKNKVLEDWDYKRDYASLKGNCLHKFIERYLDRAFVPLDKDKIEYFFRNEPSKKDVFYQEIADTVVHIKEFGDLWKTNYVSVKSEFVIGDEEYGVSGTIDNLSYNFINESLVIFDYKTNKNVTRVNKFFKRFKLPLEHLDHTLFNKYSLQLNAYKYILEKNTPFKIKRMILIWFNLDGYEEMEIPDMQNEVKIMFDYSKRFLQ